MKNESAAQRHVLDIVESVCAKAKDPCSLMMATFLRSESRDLVLDEASDVDQSTLAGGLYSSLSRVTGEVMGVFRAVENLDLEDEPLGGVHQLILNEMDSAYYGGEMGFSAPNLFIGGDGLVDFFVSAAELTRNGAKDGNAAPSARILQIRVLSALLNGVYDASMCLHALKRCADSAVADSPEFGRNRPAAG